jgi:hypothetical protein
MKKQIFESGSTTSNSRHIGDYRVNGLMGIAMLFQITIDIDANGIITITACAQSRYGPHLVVDELTDPSSLFSKSIPHLATLEHNWSHLDDSVNQ